MTTAHAFDLRPEPAGTTFAALTRTLGLAGGKTGLAVRMLDAGELVAPPAVQRILRAAVGGASLGNLLSGPGDFAIARASFFASLRSQSIFFRALDGGMARVPFQAPIAITSSTLIGSEIGEGKPIPLGSVGLTKGRLQPRKVGSLLVATRELLQANDGGPGDLLGRELRAATAAAVDTAMLAALAGDITSVPATTSMAVDIAAALTAMSKTGAEQLLWAASPAVAVTMTISAMAPDDMSPSGGTFMRTPAIVSAALPDDSLLLLDVSALAGNADQLDLMASGEADIQMDSAPVSDAITGTGAAGMVSMFQTNSIAMKTIIGFGVEALRTPVGFEITGINWSA